MDLTSILIWIVLGGLSGWIASRLMGAATNIVTTVILGILGAVVGGWLFNQFGQTGTTGLNVWSVLVAVVGAVVVLFIYQLVTGKRSV